MTLPVTLKLTPRRPRAALAATDRTLARGRSAATAAVGEPSDQDPVFALEILNIKPAGTGSPALPSTNRIFRAYPGIEYNIRVACIGGVYPYTYALSNAPSGMTIDSETGEIVWPDPQANATDITVTVTDQRNDDVSASWSITVGTSGFLFVDASYSGTQTGSISQPYSSFASMRSANGSNPTAIVYFRAGTYTMNAGGSLGSMPHNWLAYPGETATIDMDGQQGVWSEYGVWFDGMRFANMVNSCVLFYGPRPYHTIRRCVYDGLVADTAVNNNQGMVTFLGSEGSNGYGNVIQDNEFMDVTGGNAIGSLYRMQKTLIENNYIHDAGYPGLTGYAGGISPKDRCFDTTVRGNRVEMAGTDVAFGALLEASGDIEICYNLFAANATTRTSYVIFGPLSRTIGAVVWRNTFVGAVDHAYDCAYDSGPFTYRHNVVVNPAASVEGNLSCVTDTDNTKATATTGLIDPANLHKLVAGQSGLVGQRGWQLSDGRVPTEL